MMKLALLDNPPRALADASDGAGQAAAGAAVQSSGPHAHHGADVYGRWFGRGGDARKRRLAWVGALAPELKALGPAGGRVRGDAVLPGGQTVEDFAQGRLARVIPMEVRHGTEAQGKGYFALRQVAQWDVDFAQAHPKLGRTTQEYADQFQREYAERLEKLRQESGCQITAGKAALASYRAGKLDRRARNGRKPEELFDAELFDEAIALYIHPNRLKTRGPLGIYAYCQAKAAAEGKLWRGGQETFAQRLRAAVPEPARRLGRDGEWKYERDSVPKLVRPRDLFACGEAASLDGTTSDQLVRVPNRSGGWKPIRPTETVFFDVASGYPLGWHIAESESADTTWLALRHMHDRVGLVRRAETDNGKGFVCAFGAGGRRKYATNDVRWLHSLCEYLRIEVDHKVPRHAWKKTAETRFSRFKPIDRLAPHYVGESPDERPEDVLRRAKLDILDVPTMDKFRRQREADYELYANTPSEALGGLTARQYFDAHRGPVVRTDPEFLAFASCRMVGSRIVGQNGVEYKNIVFGRTDEEVHKLQRRKVWLRIDPADLSAIWLCDERGAPLCIAERSDLDGATPEHLAESQKRIARMRKAARAFVAEHAFFRGTAISQVRQVLSEQRKAEDAEYRRQHAPPEPAPVQIVASEHVPAVKRAKAAQRRAETRRTLQTEGPSTPAQTALDLLLAGGRARPPEKPDSDGECQADRLMRFGHAG